MSSIYKVPPIVETVIELRLQDRLEYDRIVKSKRKFLRNYPQEEELQEITTEIGPAGATLNSRKTGLRFRTEDQLEILLVTDQNFTVSQLAPYRGWDLFMARMQRDWGIYKDTFGPKRLSRLGIRTINRIDTKSTPAIESDYLTVHTSPPKIDGLAGETFTSQMTVKLPDNNHQATIITSLVNSPIPDNVSFLLDIDVFSTVDIPMRDDNLWARLSEMHQLKNLVFEASITDKARERFN